jgi:hypothetical protein
MALTTRSILINYVSLSYPFLNLDAVAANQSLVLKENLLNESDTPPQSKVGVMLSHTNQ